MLPFASHVAQKAKGVGLSQDMNIWNTRSLGLRLVRTLAAQLGAGIEVITNCGTEVRLVHPQPEKAS